MKASVYLAQHERMRGHFYRRAGQNLWDVIWAIDVIGFHESAHLRLSFNLSTRYRGGPSCRGRSRDEAIPEHGIELRLREMERAFAVWSQGRGPLRLPDWAYGELLANTRAEYERQGAKRG